MSVAEACRSLVSASGRRLEPAPEDVRAGFLADALAMLRRRRPRGVLARSPVFFTEEISEVIKGRALGLRDEYLALDREGRWRGLEQPVRQTVWEVYEEYQARLEAAGLHDPDDLPLLALATGVPMESRFDDVIVDDAHGLSRAALLLLGELAATRDRLFVLADEDQRYHRQGFSMKDAGIDVRRSVELTGAYRPAGAIRAFADGILRGETDREPARDRAAGCADVAIAEAPSFAAQFALAADRVEAEIARGVPADEIAVLCATARDLLVARRAIEARAARVAGPGPGVLTIDAARGLEFASVVVCGVNEGTLPADEPGHDLTGPLRDRRRLYVAATRARERLAFVCTAGLRSSFLPSPA
jgi:superfamily I DNA/RNA helicase